MIYPRSWTKFSKHAAQYVWEFMAMVETLLSDDSGVYETGNAQDQGETDAGEWILPSTAQ